ncbi:MAG: hypothetical protein ACRDZY_08010, partial [Acidimicrobiales bacterium]
MECCDGADHWLDSYSGDERRLLVEVEELNRALMGAADAGLDISAVLDALDPDPARYTWVDEGGGVAGAFVARAGKLLADAPALAGHRLVDSEVLASDHASSRPALAVRADGAVVVAWVEWVEGRGDQVVASVLGPDGRPRAGAPAPAVVSGDLADCLRPSAVWDREGRPWAFFGRRDPGAGVAVWCTRLEGGAWTGPERVSTTSHPSFNQEVAAHDDGSLECCWQGYAAGRFGVLTRAFRDGAWGETEQLGRGGTDERNVWDPVVAGLPGGGSAYAWTTYGPGGYRTAVLVRRPGQEEEAYRLGDGGAYSLHPSLAVSGDGTIWCAYDRVVVGGHGGSG